MQVIAVLLGLKFIRPRWDPRHSDACPRTAPAARRSRGVPS